MNIVRAVATLCVALFTASLVDEQTRGRGSAFEVGYESPSPFSREYSRLFGVPPRRHAVELRALASA